MEIRDAIKVELITQDAGIEVSPQFRITFEDGRSSMVPCDPLNRQFVEIKEWYESLDEKPFEFNFELDT